jgi:PTH1 family peptidyl-tRNA hydrolase
MVLDVISKQRGIPIKRNRGDALIGKGHLWDDEFLLVKPLTYMNLSGLPVKRLVEEQGLTTEKVIIIHDDIDIEFGRIRIKQKGGNGGHRGVRSIINALEDDRFLRLRIGIGRPKVEMDISDYVLSPFSNDQRDDLETLLDLAVTALESVCLEGVATAMNRFHR